MYIAYIIIGVVLGALSGWIVAQSRYSRKVQDYTARLSSAETGLLAAKQNLADKGSEIEKLNKEIIALGEKVSDGIQKLATESAVKEALKEKLLEQKKELEDMAKKLNVDFEIIANRILDNKTEKFTELNKKNLDAILEPLGKNIEEFKKTVKDTYITEAKERFSLGEKVKELAQLNQQISEEARNLTRALKSQSKTQGRWGEMILESILEKSGLRKDEEYFMEQQLLDDQGKPLRSDSEGKKMRPDAVIKYPDDRKVIIDSKVSLNAFLRFMNSTDPEEQKQELAGHIQAVKDHIDELNNRGYDDYSKSLDFVMMFIPSEPAYIAAMQGDPELWNYAYDRRILLLNPTNLITSLKLIVDLWKRDQQNRNAQQIAERGAKLYDKFVGFIENLQEIGKHIDQAKEAYTDSFNQLSSGKGNLVSQATTLKNLGIKNKKEIPEDIAGPASENELPD
ncbi:MAG: DNA recombination protein RmuC [Bacteroidia bacterium]|nr:DNA recombination protein RmuC [Bacteroidia bacterium]